ncbi:MAG TPA: lysine/arginine/ornithine ABC transporter substrate-binding protein [Thermohalobaculum sp.]|nr:lysine/arginine/ornithine ABC transporter substrate-binding protein [Thermohalobaculum sp.]
MKRLVAAAAFAAFATSAAAADLNICVEGAYPPFSEINASGEVIGFDIDIANALCAEMGKSCAMVQSEWDGIIPALLEGKCDAIIASMSITEERMQRIDFSKKYYNTPGRFVAKEGAGLTDTAEGLKGKVIGLQRGTTYNDFMDGEMPDVELKLYGTQDEVYLDLVAGRIDAAFADAVAIEDGFLKTDAGKGYAFFGGDYAQEKYFGVGAGIGVRKGEEALRDGFSAAIQAIRDNGTYKAINDKYFAVDIYGG